MTVYGYIKTRLGGLDILLEDNGDVTITSPQRMFNVTIPCEQLQRTREILGWFIKINEQRNKDATGQNAEQPEGET